MYVDGFLAPVKTARKAEYVRMIKTGSRVFRDHGALSWTECWADDVPHGKTTSFPRALKLKEDETVVFAWITYPNKKTRDACMKKAFEDPRMAAMMDNTLMDGKRMIFGGFKTILEA